MLLDNITVAAEVVLHEPIDIVRTALANIFLGEDLVDVISAQVTRLRKYDTAAFTAEFSHCGTKLATSSADATIIVWDMQHFIRPPQ